MAKFYKDKENLYISNDIIQDPELSLAAKGIYMELVFHSDKYFTVDDLYKNENDDLEEIKEGLSQLLDKNLIIQKGWKYKIRV